MQGAFAGDVSADMLAHLGCTYVIVGHSERTQIPSRGRRQHRRPGDGPCWLPACSPILCVGESYEERRKGIELDFAVGQVRDVTRDLTDAQAAAS